MSERFQISALSFCFNKLEDEIKPQASRGKEIGKNRLQWNWQPKNYRESQWNQKLCSLKRQIELANLSWLIKKERQKWLT